MQTAPPAPRAAQKGWKARLHLYHMHVRTCASAAWQARHLPLLPAAAVPCGTSATAAKRLRPALRCSESSSTSTTPSAGDMYAHCRCARPAPVILTIAPPGCLHAAHSTAARGSGEPFATAQRSQCQAPSGSSPMP